MVTATTPPGDVPHRGGTSWIFLLHALRFSLDLRKALLAAIGVIVLHAGWDVLDQLVPGAERGTAGLINERRSTVASTRASEDQVAWEHVRAAGWRLTEPERVLARPLVGLLEPGKDATRLFHALLTVLWAVCVWGICGGAIARMTVVEASGTPGPGIAGAVRFAVRFALPLIATPLCPLAAVAVCASVCAAVGLLYWLPAGIGTVLGGMFLFIPLVMGLVMAILLVGLLAGWPLMHASVAAEAEDTLDALSRSFSYLNQRLGKFVGWFGIAWLIGIPGLIAVDLLASGVIHLAAWGLNLSAPASRLGLLDDPLAGASFVSRASAALPTFWRGLIGLMARGWIYAYFWTTAAFLYLLLRQDVDGTPPTAVNPVTAPEQPSGIPVQGNPGS